MTYDDCWTYPPAKIKKELADLDARITALEEAAEAAAAAAGGDAKAETKTTQTKGGTK